MGPVSTPSLLAPPPHLAPPPSPRFLARLVEPHEARLVTLTFADKESAVALFRKSAAASRHRLAQQQQQQQQGGGAHDGLAGVGDWAAGGEAQQKESVGGGAHGAGTSSSASTTRRCGMSMCAA